jgi:hypothetical protein
MCSSLTQAWEILGFTVMAAKFTDLRRVKPYCLVELPHVSEEVLSPIWRHILPKRP